MADEYQVAVAAAITEAVAPPVPVEPPKPAPELEPQPSADELRLQERMALRVALRDRKAAVETQIEALTKLGDARTTTNKSVVKSYQDELAALNRLMGRLG